ncbi:MAG: hypothetical protein ACRDXX_07655, partial [Stackebrandtia sp.]
RQPRGTPMGRVAKLLDSLSVSALSPDGRIRARVGGLSQVTVQFRPENYRRYTTQTLEHQLGQLFADLWERHRLGCAEAVGEVGVTFQRDPGAAADPRTRDYLRRRRELEVVGASARGYVRVKTIALDDWKLRLRPETVQTLSEEEFLEELLIALRTAIRLHAVEAQALKYDCFERAEVANDPLRRR